MKCEEVTARYEEKRSVTGKEGMCGLRRDSVNATTCSGSLLKYLMISFILIPYQKVCEQTKDAE